MRTKSTKDKVKKREKVKSLIEDDEEDVWDLIGWIETDMIRESLKLDKRRLRMRKKHGSFYV